MMNNQYLQDYQIQPIGHSTAPSTSHHNSLWNQTCTINTNTNTNANANTNNHYQHTPQTTYHSSSGVAAARSNPSNGEDKLRLQLKLKDSQIESLENEIRVLKESLSALSSSTGGGANGSTNNKQESVVPVSVNEIFMKLSKSRLEVLEELSDTKLRLESLITTYTLNPSNSVTENGRYDEMEISHKILIKLETLKKENEDLLKALSFGKLKNLEMDISLVRSENSNLKRENAELLKRLALYEKA